MAKTTNQSVLRGLEGKMGDVVMRTVNDKTIVSKTPKRRSKKSTREIANHSLFQQAAAFAVECMRNPELKLYFKDVAEKRKLPNGYTAALSLKLKELNAAARRQLHEELKPVSQKGLDRVDINHFTRESQDIESKIGDALFKVTTTWRNIDRKALDENQKEVLKLIARRQIGKWLEFINRYQG